MDTVKKEDVIQYLKARMETLEGFIQGHREKIKKCEPGDSTEIRASLESIGKLQSRKNECDTLKEVIKSMK